MPPVRLFAAIAACALVAPALGCGSSSSSKSPASSSSSVSSSPASASALSADAKSAATGDIPDNQVFLSFANTAGGYSIKYPEGWTQSGAGSDVTFRDKNNVVHVLVSRGARPPSSSSVTSQLQALKRSSPTLTFSVAQSVQLPGGRAIKATYATQSAPDPVTGKRVLLLVDRYELAGTGRVATVDLGTPKGVDNVDAYRRMIESFSWR
jgi:PsbP